MRRKLLVAVLAAVTLVATLAIGGGAAEAHRRRRSRGSDRSCSCTASSGPADSSRARRCASPATAIPSTPSACRSTTRCSRRSPARACGTSSTRRSTPSEPKYHADKVDLVGHSLGTSMSQGYLNSSPERAARVAHYANLDGAPAAGPPAGIPTVAVWAEGNQGRSIPGATNVYLPDQSHVQAATSAETFAAMYELFNGRTPKTTSIVRQHRVSLAGRVQAFPSNAPASADTLQIWEVDGRTGLPSSAPAGGDPAAARRRLVGAVLGQQPQALRDGGEPRGQHPPLLRPAVPPQRPPDPPAVAGSRHRSRRCSGRRATPPPR